jgi:CheY-like chemotaxis protein
MARLLIVEDSTELALLISAAARTRGLSPLAVYSGQDAMDVLAQESFDLAIIDLLLPDIQGSELLEQLKSRKVPAIAISGAYRGDPFAQSATSVHGAIAFFEKPFQLKALLDRAMEALTPKEAPAPSSPELRPDDLRELAEPVSPPKALSKEKPAAADEDSAPLPFAERERVWQKAAPDGEPKPAPTFSKAGDITPGAVPRLLSAYYQANHSGELKLKQGNVLKVVYFEDGKPVYAASNLASERFGRFCVRKGALKEEQLVTVANAAKERGLRSGEAMVTLGMLTDAQRRELLEAQVKEIIWSTFAWEKGEYTCDSKRPNRNDLVRLSVFPGTLILEGVQKVETLLTLRKKMMLSRTLFPTADPPYALNEIPFTGPQAQLFASADGSKSVEDLLSLTEMTERDALALLYACELMTLLEERRDERKHRRISFGL